MANNYRNAALAADCQAQARAIATAALTAAPGFQSTVLSGAERLQRIGASLARKSKATTPRVAILPANATAAELRKSRRTQATQQGNLVYLPAWQESAQALPNALLRCALFASTDSVQAENTKALAADTSNVVADERINSYDTVTVTLTGHKLCQFDRKVFAACLDFYREIPLAKDDSAKSVETTIYGFALRMGQSYGLNTHRAILASLLRLSSVKIQIHTESGDNDIPRLLSVKFKDGDAQRLKGSDPLELKVFSSIAKLFGPRAWTVLEKTAVAYDGLHGWLASFYASHACGKWLEVNWLHELCGYKSHGRNFRTSLLKALDKLTSEDTPESCRIKEYHLSANGLKLLVLRPGWKKPGEPADDRTRIRNSGITA